MPLFEYSCDFHKIFEIVQSIKDSPLEACPQCKEEGRVYYYCDKCDAIYDRVSLPIENIKCTNCFKDLEPLWHKPKKLISLGSFHLKGGGWGSEGYK